MGEPDLRVKFDGKLKLEFHGTTFNSDARLLGYCELDEAFGLTIAKHLLEMMSGPISLESELGKGSRFTIELPEGEETGLIKKSDTEKEKEAAPSGTKQLYTLLYVEDNPANLKLVERFFKLKPNIKILFASRAQLGIDLARAHHPDLILMDIYMPGMNGITAMKILQNYEETRDIPVIAVTASAMESEIQRGLDAGFKAYITKPFNIQNFFMEIDRFLKPENSSSVESAK